MLTVTHVRLSALAVLTTPSPRIRFKVTVLAATAATRAWVGVSANGATFTLARDDIKLEVEQRMTTSDGSGREIRAGILIIGSLFWDDKKARKDWRRDRLVDLDDRKQVCASGDVYVTNARGERRDYASTLTELFPDPIRCASLSTTSCRTPHQQRCILPRQRPEWGGSSPRVASAASVILNFMRHRATHQVEYRLIPRWSEFVTGAGTVRGR